MGKEIPAKGIQSKREKESQISEAAPMASTSSEVSFISQPLHLPSLFTSLCFAFLQHLSLENFKFFPSSRSNVVLATLTIAGALAERGPHGSAHSVSSKAHLGGLCWHR